MLNNLVSVLLNFNVNHRRVWFYVVYGSKLRLFVFMGRTLRLFCQFGVSLAYKCLVFSIVFDCFTALKMSGLMFFCSK